MTEESKEGDDEANHTPPPSPPPKPSGRDKKRVNAALPAGVTEKDVQLFTKSQDKAKAFLTEENKGLEDESGSPRAAPPAAPRTPSHHALALPGRALASPGAPAARTPQMIQF